MAVYRYPPPGVELTSLYRKSLEEIGIGQLKMEQLKDVSFDVLDHLIIASEEIIHEFLNGDRIDPVVRSENFDIGSMEGIEALNYASWPHYIEGLVDK